MSSSCRRDGRSRTACSADGLRTAGSSGGTTSGQTVWCSSDEDEDIGVHASWGLAKHGAVAAVVTFHGTRMEVPVENGHYAWLVEGVPIGAINESVEIRWLP